MTFDRQGFAKDMENLFNQPGSFLSCTVCHREMPMVDGDGIRYLTHGWPRCCSLTMRLWTAEQVERGEAPLGRLNPTTHARTTDPSTSHEAANRLSDKRTMLRKLLLSYSRPGAWLTAEEVSDRAGYVAADGAWKRVSDLLRLGLLEDTGIKRPGSSGRMQRVLRISEAGRRAVQ
jgi:hypothetical protein